jgi:hypothetical protein
LNVREMKNQADYLMGRRAYRRAEKLYCTLVRLDPGDPRLHVRLAELLRRRGEDGLAAREYRKASELFAGAGLDARAKAAFNMARMLDPSVPALPVRAGRAALRAGIVLEPAAPEPAVPAQPEAWPQQPQTSAPPSEDLMGEETFELIYGPADGVIVLPADQEAWSG